MERTNIQKVSDALLCSNCGACKAVCPKDAISFSSTPLGRMFALVNEHCLDCGLCAQVCPSLDQYDLHKVFLDKFVGNIKKVYVGKSTNDTIFKNAQSGGACIATIAYLFDTGSIDCAVLCQMSYGNPPVVKSVVIENKEQLADFQKSCYTPVDVLSALKETREKKSIAIVGLPCHIQGAELLMRKSKKFHNIHFKIGLICDRTLCGGIQNVMLSFIPLEKVKILWRDKRIRTVGGTNYSYQNAPIIVTCKDGQERVLPNSYRFVLKDYFTSPRCRVCYDKLNTFSDIVLGDPWGMSGIDWWKGESVVVVRTPVGEQLVNEMVKTNHLSLSERSTEELLNGQHIEERRQQTDRYSQALQVIPKKIDSYLYKQGRNQEAKADKEKDEIIDFMRRDGLAEDEILRETHEIIKKHIVRQCINNIFIIRFLRRIKRKFRL